MECIFVEDVLWSEQMNANEKQLRYQAQARLGQMKRSGAKPAVIERMRQAIAGDTRSERKGKTFGPKRG
jgi:hypothetical protein